MKNKTMLWAVFLALGLILATPALAATCSDSDGFDVFTAGFVSGVDGSGTPYSSDDYCIGNIIVEYYCLEEEPTFALGQCDPILSSGCMSGRCVPSF